MYSSFLQPPNYLALGDNIVGAVNQRAPNRPSHVEGVDDQAIKLYRSALRLSGETRRTTSLGLPTVAKAAKLSTDTRTRQTDASRDFPLPKGAAGECSALSHATVKGWLSTLRVSPKKSNLLQRQQHRKHQARYRQKQIKKVEDLQHGIDKLQEEIRELGFRRSIATPPEITIWAIALEYFRVFRSGFKTPAHMWDTFALEFLRRTMTPDVTDGNLCGPEDLLRNWGAFSFCFADIRVDLKRMEMVADDSLMATTVTSVTISRETLRLVFPHLNSDGQGGIRGGKWLPLAEALEGQRLEMRSSVRFDWDSTDNRVMRMQTQSDMLTPLLQILGTLENVSLVLDGALVTSDCRLVIEQKA